MVSSSSSSSSEEVHKFRFIHPFTMVVTEPRMSRKSTWIKKLLIDKDQLISPVPQQILWIYKRWQPQYAELK
jgi:hypothetical protein